eukprot:jgi/Mesvir1/11996/Mv00302-RA.1
MAVVAGNIALCSTATPTNAKKACAVPRPAQQRVLQSTLWGSSRISRARHGGYIPVSSTPAVKGRAGLVVKASSTADVGNTGDVVETKVEKFVDAKVDCKGVGFAFVELRADAINRETVELGKSGVRVSPVGVGAWAWGDKFFWGFGSGYGEDDVRQAFNAANKGGLTFVDTAEVYGLGVSEQLVGEFERGALNEITVATKFAPLPWRTSSGSVVDALRASLARMKRESVDLYMIHWPGLEVLGMGPNKAYLQGLVDCHRLGLAKAVGVSNFNANRLRDAHKFLADKGVVLACNQVQYSLLYRRPETNGVADACQDLGVTLMAYSPLAQGLLTGKFADGSVKPVGPRSSVFTEDRLRLVDPVLAKLRSIGAAHGGKTPAQVALNWCMAKGTLPIPGVKNPRQAQECAGALGWKLTQEEVAELDAATAKLEAMFGSPLENL